MNIDLDSLNIEQIVSGYVKEKGGYRCIVCAMKIEDNEAYPFGSRFFTGEKAAEEHVKQEHPHRFTRLINSDNKYISLTDKQKQLLELMYAGHSDNIIAAKTQSGTAPVRRQRFMLKERARQAKIYLALYEMAMEGRGGAKDEIVAPPEGEAMFDDRFIITEEENRRFLNNAFHTLEPLKLIKLPVKEKKKVAVLRRIIKEFEQGRQYSEKEVNAILKNVHSEDYVTLRRYLIEYGYMDRENDGSKYWLK